MFVSMCLCVCVCEREKERAFEKLERFIKCFSSQGFWQLCLHMCCLVFKILW